MDTPKKNEALIKDKEVWLYFSDPHELILATSLEEVPKALHEIERKVEEYGWHAAGFLSYEAASALDPALATHRTPEFPYLWFGLFSQPETIQLPKPDNIKVSLDWQSTVRPDAYNTAIRKIRGYISQGRTYQVNYTMRLHTGFDMSAWEFFLQLAQDQNQHGAYLDTGRYVICSASPELFFELDRETITSRPMKGTARRGRTTQEDKLKAEWLRNSEKNQAENVMIVDMVRNDMGKIAKIGSVHVPELFNVERYPTLWQMTSTVTAQTGASLSGIFSALFPCASITGAPKVSTMRIIHELEPVPRRIYTGTIGYLTPGRKAKFNVAIRTALIDRLKQKAEYGIGGGIVWDSTSADEYAEALLKARVLSASSSQFSILETILWTSDEGYFLKDRHIERLLDSAYYFDFLISKKDLEEHLNRISASFDRPQRVRLTLDRKGRIEITSASISFEEKLLHVALADKPVQSTDVFLFHKTTRRDVYDTARNNHPDFDDILLYNEHNELTEFSIGNLVVELDGELLTPPINCGLLPGTFRAHLVETGKVTERIVPLHRLKECTRIFRVNSVRKWETVHIQ